MRTSSASAKATSDLPDPPSAPKLRNYLPDSRLFVSTSMPRYQLSLEAENLKRKLLHVPSPYARVQITGGPKEGTVVGQTQTIERTLHPVWTEVFFLETDSSIYMPLKISVFDDRGGASDDELLGEVTFEAIEIYQSAGRTKSEKLRNGVRYVCHLVCLCLLERNALSLSRSYLLCVCVASLLP